MRRRRGEKSGAPVTLRPPPNSRLCRSAGSLKMRMCVSRAPIQCVSRIHRESDRWITPEPTVKESSVALAQDVKKQIIADYGSKEGDTGSPEVQVALLSRRISDPTENLKTH